MSDANLWFIAFVGAINLIFALKAEVGEWFVFFTLLFASCAATVVVFI